MNAAAQKCWDDAEKAAGQVYDAMPAATAFVDGECKTWSAMTERMESMPILVEMFGSMALKVVPSMQNGKQVIFAKPDHPEIDGYSGVARVAGLFLLGEFMAVFKSDGAGTTEVLASGMLDQNKWTVTFAQLRDGIPMTGAAQRCWDDAAKAAGQVYDALPVAKTLVDGKCQTWSAMTDRMATKKAVAEFYGNMALQVVPAMQPNGNQLIFATANRPEYAGADAVARIAGLLLVGDHLTIFKSLGGKTEVLARGKFNAMDWKVTQE